MLMSNTVIYVEWIDSSEYDDASWKSEKEVKELTPMRIKSCGFLVNEDDIYLTLSGSINNYDKECEAQYGGLLSIPKCAILKQLTLHREEEMSERMKEIHDGTWPGPGV
jgi:hypothetical protein